MKRKPILLKTCGWIVLRKLHFARMAAKKRRKTQARHDASSDSLLGLASFLMKKCFPHALCQSHIERSFQKASSLCKSVNFFSLSYHLCCKRILIESFWCFYKNILLFLFYFPYSRRWNPHSRFSVKREPRR